MLSRRVLPVLMIQRTSGTSPSGLDPEAVATHGPAGALEERSCAVGVVAVGERGSRVVGAVRAGRDRTTVQQRCVGATDRHVDLLEGRHTVDRLRERLAVDRVGERAVVLGVRVRRPAGSRSPRSRHRTPGRDRSSGPRPKRRSSGRTAGRSSRPHQLRERPARCPDRRTARSRSCRSPAGRPSSSRW